VQQTLGLLMPSYRDLFQVHLTYADYIREKSLLVHQYVRNISVTGSGVENEVRAVLRSIIPERFRITTGYIVSAENRNIEPTVSPQVDILIVDTLVPHSLWLVDPGQGIEIVPLEAVVGIIEVKRTLDASSLHSAVSHLTEILTRSRVRKDDDTGYIPGGLTAGNGLTVPYRSNPLIGIIGLAADEVFAGAPADRVRAALESAAQDGGEKLILDFVLTLSGLFVGTASPIVVPGQSNYDAKLVQTESSEHWAEESARTGTSGRAGLAKGLGFIQAYICQTCGRIASAESYFFNSSIQ
jgi:hypothetical protein